MGSRATPCAVLLLAALASEARADLLDRTIHDDSGTTHSASIVDTMLFPAGTAQRSAHWSWAAEQKLATDGRTWLIEVRGRHAAGANTDGMAEGPFLVAVLPGLAPGGAGARLVRAPHPGTTHVDTLMVGYVPESAHRSRLTIRFEHAGDDPPPARAGTGWTPALASAALVLLGRSAWARLGVPRGLR
jgi:hypothetical protein